MRAAASGRIEPLLFPVASLSKHPRAGPALHGLTLAEVQTAAPLRCTTPARIIFASDDCI